MNEKQPTNNNTDADLARFAQNLADIRAERDLLAAQKTDIEHTAAIMTDRAERAERELDRLCEQFAAANRAAVERETLIQTIAGAIVSHLRGPGVLAQAFKNGGDDEPLSDATIGKIVERFKPPQIEQRSS